MVWRRSRSSTAVSAPAGHWSWQNDPSFRASQQERVAMTTVLALVLAGGEGTRLRPLTDQHAKPALVLARGYRIVDFVLGNLVNSGVSSIEVLVQYKPRTLVEHIHTAWTPWTEPTDQHIDVRKPLSDRAEDAFKGTADAVFRNLGLVARHRPDIVAVFAADHVYRMDVRQMIEFHLHHHAEVSVAAVPVPLEGASGFGIMAVDSDARIRDFQEKPARPKPMPGDPKRAYASMGNYLFDPEALVSLLQSANRCGETDFGRHILPRALLEHRVLAYDFSRNRVPGLRSCEERAYWRDIGTVEAFRAAQRDVQGPLPRFSLTNPQWPIRPDPSGSPQTSPGVSAAATVQLHA